MPSATIIDETRSSSMPPYCSGSSTPTSPSSADLRKRALQNIEVLVLNRFQIGRDFAGPEIFGGFGDGAMLGGEVLGREDVRRRVQQEGASEGVDMRMEAISPRIGLLCLSL